MSALTVSGLGVRYGDTAALVGVDLDLGEGRVCALVGTNGSGKSSLLRAVMGLVAHTGTVRVLGDDPAHARRSQWIGYVPQAEELDVRFPIDVAQVVATGRYGRLGPTRRPGAADRRAAADALDVVGLGDRGRAPYGDLSGGQRRRVLLARAIAQEARLLLLDEPFAGVDVASAATIAAVLRELAARGVAALVATHDLAGVTALADEALLLAGRVVAHGPPAQVLTPDRLAEAFGGRA